MATEADVLAIARDLARATAEAVQAELDFNRATMEARRLEAEWNQKMMRARTLEGQLMDAGRSLSIAGTTPSPVPITPLLGFVEAGEEQTKTDPPAAPKPKPKK